MEEQRIAKSHKLVVNNRKTSMVTGVLDVLSFDLNEILLETQRYMLQRWAEHYEVIFSNAVLLELTRKGSNKGGMVDYLAQ